MNVHLTPELVQLVQNKVKTGRYNSASEVMREALRLMEDRDQAKEDVRRKIADGIKSLSQGDGTDGDALFAEMEAELDKEIRLQDEYGTRELLVA